MGISKAEYEFRRSIESPNTKFCGSCRAVKPRIDFNVKRGTRDGLSSSCRDCASSSNAAWRAANPARHRDNARAWAEPRRALIRDRNRTRRDSNPLYGRLVTAKSRAKKRGCVVDNFSVADLLRHWEANNIHPNRCYYTGLELDRDFHLDHMQPLSRGGKHSVENIVPCAISVNLSKRDLTAEEYQLELSRR